MINAKEFGRTKNGQKVTAFELDNENGMSVRILDLGGTVQSMVVSDREGNPVDVVLGYGDVPSYEKGTCFYGAIVGRFANRIKDCRIVIDGREYLLEKNSEESNHVHGIFHQRMFLASAEGDTLRLRYQSPDGEEGFPGNLNLEVCYTLLKDNSLVIDYSAKTDAPTVVNLTNHTYFNLNGQDGSTVFDHRVRLNSSNFTEYTESFAQTGNIIPVQNTPLDFREEYTIGERFYDDYHQFRICTGYDHNMIIDGKPGELNLMGIVKSDKTGICLEAFTTEPAFQFYSSNYIHYDAAGVGKSGFRYPKNGAVCLEAQHYPDSPRHPHFPSTVLRPGEVYRQKTVYRLYSE